MGQTNLGIVCNDLCLAMVGGGLKGTIGMALVIMLETHDKRICATLLGETRTFTLAPKAPHSDYVHGLKAMVCECLSPHQSPTFPHCT